MPCIYWPGIVAISPGLPPRPRRPTFGTPALMLVYFLWRFIGSTVPATDCHNCICRTGGSPCPLVGIQRERPASYDRVHLGSPFRKPLFSIHSILRLPLPMFSSQLMCRKNGCKMLQASFLCYCRALPALLSSFATTGFLLSVRSLLNSEYRDLRTTFMSRAFCITFIYTPA